MTQLGKLPPRYRFFLNPYQDVRFTRCPQCTHPTQQRKLSLFIHVDPMHPVLLNKTCRYCPTCDLLIAHRNEIEDLLASLFTARAPEIVGKAYLVLGTVDRAAWKQRIEDQLPLQDSLAALHDFKEVVTFQPARNWGWGKSGQ